ncbi:ferritin-like domain-containing protein [Ramlibacter algicola]|uniref:Ferritin-like domain-containing protein n=1 Tax=Ramlibacter algicola TaxID=2795217 RepID=A0A934PXZ5_9BURK|nr:ferritin-like domain-containing protein [Ramlibacter algicola]MBK0392600.1 ferritin-like domain-containing protein [Ramlibacter algicola]
MSSHVNHGIEQQPRRVFLGLAGLGLIAASTSAVAAGAKAKTKDVSNDASVMQVALALEHEGIAAYRIAGSSGLLKPGTLRIAQVFRGHHEQHRDSLASLIAKTGGKPVQPLSDDQYVEALNLGALKTEGDVVALATRLEQGAASAYVGQVAALRDPKLAQLFSNLAADEAVHWTTLNNAQGLEIRSRAYLFG